MFSLLTPEEMIFLRGKTKSHWNNLTPDTMCHRLKQTSFQRRTPIRSSGIVAQTLMLAAKSMGYDSCPMDGFDFEKVGEQFNKKHCFLFCLLQWSIMKNSIREPLIKIVLVVLMASCSFLLSCKASPVGNSPDGKRWFSMQHCDACHGQNGLGGRAPEIQQSDLSYAELLDKLRKSESLIMPSYAHVHLSDQEVADISSYLWAMGAGSRTQPNQIEFP